METPAIWYDEPKRRGREAAEIKKKWIGGLLLLTALLAAAFFVYTGSYYRADAQALAALESDGAVSVARTGYGWHFDGPGEADALIFYPGGKVEESAYAPLLHRLAAQGLDVCLVKMPFRLAVFDTDAAEEVMAVHDYERWTIGGHSLGGAMAARFAAEYPETLDGVVLLAAYPTKALDDRLWLLTVYGSEDGVLDREKWTAGEPFAPKRHESLVIQGGNHAQFGNYGAQRGDGEAAVSAQEQQRRTAEWITKSIIPEGGPA